MMANPGLQRLMQYGLTEYEARTYLALMGAGASGARDLANVSRVPRTKIYGVLDELHAKGLVQLLPERPKRYEAVQVDKYLATFEDDLRKKLERLRADREAMAHEFQRVPAARAERAGNFHVVKGRRNVSGRLLEMLARAEGEVVLAGSASLPLRLRHHLPELLAAAQRGVQLRLVFALEPRNQAAVEALRGVAEVRGASVPSAGSGTLVVDGKESLMCHFVPDDEHLYKGDDVGIWSDDQAIVADMRRTLEQHWQQGEGPAAASV
jgi:HTH-type transcriptional regulator, sugar sensing transcriptional regulator